MIFIINNFPPRYKIGVKIGVRDEESHLHFSSFVVYYIIDNLQIQRSRGILSNSVINIKIFPKIPEIMVNAFYEIYKKSLHLNIANFVAERLIISIMYMLKY